MSAFKYQTLLKSWSNMIKKLDNNMCKNCDSKEKLNAHHIQPKSEFPDMALDVNNGVTLCEECHSKVHGFKIY